MRYRDQRAPRVCTSFCRRVSMPAGLAVRNAASPLGSADGDPRLHLHSAIYKGCHCKDTAEIAGSDERLVNPGRGERMSRPDGTRGSDDGVRGWSPPR